MAGRRSFSEAEKQRIVDEASQPGVTLSQIARRYGISPPPSLPLEGGTKAEAAGVGFSRSGLCAGADHRRGPATRLLPQRRHR